MEFVTPNVAVVRAIAEFDEIKTRLSETYVLIKDNDQWKIRVHEAGGTTIMPAR